jgi:hypothetical protein
MTWQAQLDRFRKNPAAGAWALPRERVADDLAALLAAPDSLNQGPFGFCGIAAVLRFWLRRDPDAVARFACELYDHGTSPIGGVRVTANERLRKRDYLADLAHDDRCPPGQWMVLGAIQDHIAVGGFFGTPDQSWTSFIDLHEGSNPRDLVPLLKATGLYRDVDDRVDWTSIVLPRLPWTPFPRPSLKDALALAPGDTSDVILLVNDCFLAGGGIPSGWLGRIQLDFPNHYVALQTPLTVTDGYVTGRIWTWADYQDLHVGQAQFLRNYYGSVVSAAA